MTRVRILGVAAVLSALLAGGAAFAQGPGPGGRGPGGGPGFGRGGGLALGALNLTDAQREQIRTLRQQHQQQNRTTAERLRTAMEAQRKAVESVPVDEQLIRSTTAALAEAQTEMALARARMHSEVYALLTAEQQAELTKLQAQREQRRTERRDRMQQRMQQRRQG